MDKIKIVCTIKQKPALMFILAQSPKCPFNNHDASCSGGCIDCLKNNIEWVLVQNEQPDKRAKSNQRKYPDLWPDFLGELNDKTHVEGEEIDS